MKRFIAIGSAVVAAALIITAAVAATRPEWLPAGLRAQTALAAAPAEDAGLYCKEHGVPEKFCTLCHEELKKTPAALQGARRHPRGHLHALPSRGAEREVQHRDVRGARAAGALLLPVRQRPRRVRAAPPDDGWCATHNKPEALCVECQLGPRGSRPDRRAARGLPTAVADGAARLRQALRGQVGIETVPVTEEDHAHMLEANAETAYDGNRYAEIYPRVTGFLREVRADLGDAVRPGDVLAVVDSAEVSGAKAAVPRRPGRASNWPRSTYERIQVAGPDRGSVAAKAGARGPDRARTRPRPPSLDAEQKLRNFGFDDADLDRIIKRRGHQQSSWRSSPRSTASVVAGTPSRARRSSRRRSSSPSPTPRRCGSGSTSTSPTSTAVTPGQQVRFAVSGSDEALATRARSPGSAPRSTRRPGPPASGPSWPTPRAGSGPTSSARPRSRSATSTTRRGRPQGRRPAQGRRRRWSSCPQGDGRLPPAAGRGQAHRPGRGRRGRLGPEAGPGGRHHRGVPAQDRDHEGRHRRRLLRVTRDRRSKEAEPMLNALIDFSLKNRFVVLLAAGILIVVGVRAAQRAAAGRLPGHDAGPGPGQHRRPGALARGGRAADHLPGRVRDRRPEGAGRGPLGLEVRALAGRRDLRRRHRHLLRPPADQRAARRGRSCPRGSPGRRWARSPRGWARSTTTC